MTSVNGKPPRKGSKTTITGFRLSNFESKLRSILGVSSSRPPGVPGGNDKFPSDDLPVQSFASEYLIGNLMSKFDDGRSSERKSEAALRRFNESESQCAEANLRLGSVGFSQLGSLHAALPIAREVIFELLGPTLDLNRVARGFGWGPGASSRLTRTKGDAAYKYTGIPECTPNAYMLATAAILQSPLWTKEALVEGGPNTVFGSRFTTVPKNYKTDRAIAIEPDLNMYLQKGLGSVIRQKLKTVGIDLDDQTRNASGCYDQSLATIDFSMASDTVCQALVHHLLPAAYADFVQQTRSELVTMPDRSLRRLHKVSSMGNGYTFELETLLFWAMAVACIRLAGGSFQDVEAVRVYGDDVLIPVRYAQLFIEVTEVAGFIPNWEKSFLDGPFRESCGTHVYRGFDVTPFYVRRPVDQLEELFLLHNNLRRWVERLRRHLPYWTYDSLNALLRAIRGFAPAEWRKPRLPDGYGDGAFIGSFAECNPSVHKGGWEYFRICVWEESSRVVKTEVPGLLVKAVHNLHKRKWVTPTIQESILVVNPSRGGRRRRRVIAVPWSAFG